MSHSHLDARQKASALTYTNSEKNTNSGGGGRYGSSKQNSLGFSFTGTKPHVVKRHSRMLHAKIDRMLYPPPDPHSVAGLPVVLKPRRGIHPNMQKHTASMLYPIQ
jgi:hypothetical protein